MQTWWKKFWSFTRISIIYFCVCYMKYEMIHKSFLHFLLSKILVLGCLSDLPFRHLNTVYFPKSNRECTSKLWVPLVPPSSKLLRCRQPKALANSWACAFLVRPQYSRATHLFQEQLCQWEAGCSEPRNRRENALRKRDGKSPGVPLQRSKAQEKSVFLTLTKIARRCFPAPSPMGGASWVTWPCPGQGAAPAVTLSTLRGRLC